MAKRKREPRRSFVLVWKEKSFGAPSRLGKVFVRFLSDVRGKWFADPVLTLGGRTQRRDLGKQREFCLK